MELDVLQVIDAHHVYDKPVFVFPFQAIGQFVVLYDRHDRIAVVHGCYCSHIVPIAWRAGFPALIV